MHMKEITVQPGGAIALPPQICQRYGLTANTAVRLVETASGILVVPLTSQPMNAAAPPTRRSVPTSCGSWV